MVNRANFAAVRADFTGLFLYTINHVGGKVIQRDITD